MNVISFAGNITDGERLSKNFELIFPEKSGSIRCNGITLSFGGGDIVVVPPRKNYALDGYDGAVLVVLEQAILPHKEIAVVRDDENGGAHFAARQAQYYFTYDVEKGDCILPALGGLLAAYATAFSEKKRLSPVVETIKNQIERNLSDCSYNLEDGLKRLPLNYDYVRKLFKKETGQTPHSYLVARRMELAASLLRSGVSNQYSNYSISQVAEACGFSEPLYFSRVFKKYFSVSPSEFAQRR